MKRVFVTGGAGFVGSHVVAQPTEQGYEVVVYDRLSQYLIPIDHSYVNHMEYRLHNLLKGCTTIRGNTLNKDNLRRNLVDVRPDIIIHLAALPLANFAIKDSEEAFYTIIQGTVNLLEVLRDVNFVSKFVFTSSSMVYGDFVQEPIPEDAPKQPKDIYGGMKLAGEVLVKTYARRYDIRYNIVRPSAVYGPSDINHRVLRNFVEAALNGKPLQVVDGGKTRLDFTYVEDIAQGIRLAATDDRVSGEEFNLTRGEARTLSEAVDIIQNHIGHVEVNHVEQEAFRPKRGTLDVSKAKRLLGYKPKYRLEEGLAKYIRFVKDVTLAA